MSLSVANQCEKNQDSVEGRGEGIEGKRKWALQLLLNKLETVEKGNFYRSVIALTTGMSLKGVFKNRFLLHIHIKNLA